MCKFTRTTLLPQPDRRALVRGLNGGGEPPLDLRPTVSAMAADLVRYEAEIVRVKAMLRELEDDRDALQKSYDEARSVFSALRRFPTELLFDIFGLLDVTPILGRSLAGDWDMYDDQSEASSDTDSDEDSDERDDRRTSRWLQRRLAYERRFGVAMAALSHRPLVKLSHVCARWRDIVIGTPLLWHTVHLDALLFGLEDRRGPKILAVLQEVLLRGKTLPLHLHINGRSLRFYAPAFNLLAEHAERWETVTWTSKLAFSVERELSIHGRLPLLKQVTLTGFPPTLVKDFADAPRLRAVSCSLAQWEWFPKTTLPQLEQISVHLDVICLPTAREWPRMLAFLPRLSNTARLHILIRAQSARDIDWPMFSTDTIATSPVSALSISFVENLHTSELQRATASLFKLLTLPNLELLSFPCGLFSSVDIPWPQDEYTALATRSNFSTHLLELQLYRVVITKDQLLHCLADLHQLKRLQVSDLPRQPFGGSLLTALTMEPFIIPRLEYIGLNSTLEFTDDVLLNMLLARGNHVDDFSMDLLWMSGYCRDLDPKIDEVMEETGVFELNFESGWDHAES
ncbi:hypothetical protein R3P38DRAFT_3115231 [Favolaschia claudopus]|uniref:F-box domain-containing protein n=1 Tax=Favolaschia claudopus TaxID=2862362 RepID=A0AAV9ZG78_9AGAR